jgi:four helix bundle protein
MGNEMENDTEKGLEALQVWKDAIELAVDLCKRVIPMFPSEEEYALASQIRRSVQSIPANIAEGYGRYYYQEGIRYCYIARGSLEETKSHLILARQLGYLTDNDYLSRIKRIESLRRQLNGYIAYLKNNKRGANDPGYSYRESLHEYKIDTNLDHEPSSPIDPSPIDEYFI